ncbi:hypothetical protein GVAV_001592 [Gurleya vavrai]
MITSYITYVKLICDIFKKKKVFISSFTNLNVKISNCSMIIFFIFKYNDYKAITDLQIVVDNNFGYEEDYYFMIKNVQCANVKANFCILPCFKNIRIDSLEVIKEKLIKSIYYLKNNILIILNGNLSESKVIKTNKTINHHKIKFIKEYEWLNDFFAQQNNIKYIISFIEELKMKNFLMLLIKTSDFDVKIKLIVDWLRKKFPEN